MYGLTKCEAMVQTPGPISLTKRNMKKYFFGVSQKKKNCCLESALNFRCLHLWIKLTHKFSKKLGRNTD